MNPVIFAGDKLPEHQDPVAAGEADKGFLRRFDSDITAAREAAPVATSACCGPPTPPISRCRWLALGEEVIDNSEY